VQPLTDADRASALERFRLLQPHLEDGVPLTQLAPTEDIALRTLERWLARDLDAVRAGLSADWSTGQTEGQVKRLKTLKRQMYGRAGFTLLRNWVLQAAKCGSRGRASHCAVPGRQ
jgi:hypothetical protein